MLNDFWLDTQRTDEKPNGFSFSGNDDSILLPRKYVNGLCVGWLVGAAKFCNILLSTATTLHRSQLTCGVYCLEMDFPNSIETCQHSFDVLYFMIS